MNENIKKLEIKLKMLEKRKASGKHDAGDLYHFSRTIVKRTWDTYTRETLKAVIAEEKEKEKKAKELTDEEVEEKVLEIYNDRWEKFLWSLAHKHKHIKDTDIDYGTAEDMLFDLYKKYCAVAVKFIKDTEKEGMPKGISYKELFDRYMWNALKNHVKKMIRDKWNIKYVPAEPTTEEGEAQVRPELTTKPTFIDKGEFERMCDTLDAPYGKVVKYIVANYERGKTKEMWDEIYDRFGVSKFQVENYLEQSPKLHSFIKGLYGGTVEVPWY